MQPIEPDPRPASPPLQGAIRTTLGAATLATALVVGLGISNPVLGAAAIVAGTGLLSGVGKVSRDYLARPADQRGRFAAVREILALTFSWLG